jgi:branched-chain amino acid transport system ATP-binding protein
LLRSIAERFRTSILIQEQNAGLALGAATRGYVLTSGRITLAGTVEELHLAVSTGNLYLASRRPNAAPGKDLTT